MTGGSRKVIELRFRHLRWHRQRPLEAAAFALPFVLVLAGEAAAANGHPETERLAGLFIEACIEGELRLTPEIGVRVSEKDVSEWRRPERGSSQYFALKKPRNALLRITDFQPADEDGVVKQCALITGGHHLDTAWKIIAPAVSGTGAAKVVPNMDQYEIDFPARRYRVLMSRNWMSSFIFDEATAAKLLAQQPASSRGRARVTSRKTETIFD